MGKMKLSGVKKKKELVKKSGAEKPSVEELRKTLGFPEGTTFLGYAVYRGESEEYLGTVDEALEAGLGRKIWVRTPQQVLCYSTLAQAAQVSKDCPRSTVLGLFDTGQQIVTVTMSVNR